MERSLKELDYAPSLLLLGMRGAGKTTLGRLAAEHLKIPFVDADELFCERYAPLTPKTFVAAHGWTTFRAVETELLIELLEVIKEASKPMVVSLGGGIVEEEYNRKLLINCWSKESQAPLLDPSKKIAVVHIFREVDKMLLDGRELPSWGISNGAEVWERRRPWFRQCSSHEFVNFTDAGYRESVHAESSRAARLRFEAVERDFVAFLVRLLHQYCPSSKPFVPSINERTYLATLPFENLHPLVKFLPIITEGVDAIELRADLLRDPLVHAGSTFIEAYENPSLSYLSEQVALIRRHLPGYPLIFTLRTPAQGGRYPYPADAPATALFHSLHHALKLGCEIIDIEMRLDHKLTQRLIADAKIRKISVLLSCRDKKSPREGGFDWSSDEAKALYTEATSLGADIAKIVGTAGSVSDNFALRVFAASIEEQDKCVDDMNRDRSSLSALEARPPLSAYNMGSKGRISRFLNPLLASVTHNIAKKLTSKGVIGNPSMTFSEVQRALHLSGLLDKASFLYLYVETGYEQDVTSVYCEAFDQLGLPYSMQKQNFDDTSLGDIVAQYHGSLDGDLKGIVVQKGIVLPQEVIMDEDVIATGSCDTIVIDPLGALLGYNMLVEGLLQMIRDRISPSISLNQHRSALVLSSTNDHSRASSALHALQKLGLGQILLVDSKCKLETLLKPASIIIDARDSLHSEDDSTIYQAMAANEEGGLLISLQKSDHNLQSLHPDVISSWQIINHEQIAHEVHAIRFHRFTGRRMPVKLTSSMESL